MPLKKLGLVKHSEPGRLVVVEGLDGVGKTTLITGLAQALTENGERVLVTRQPTAAARKHAMFEKYLYQPELRHGISYPALVSIMLSDRLEHIEETIKPALREGAAVISDRYIYTMLISMVARGHDYLFAWDGAEHSLQPDISFHVTASYETAVERIRERTSAQESYVEDDLYRKMHRLYADAAELYEMVTLDTTNSRPEHTLRTAMERIGV